MTTAEIITIGTEIVLGQVVDTNAPYIAKALAERGIRACFRTSLCDDKEFLKSALKIATERTDLIITTGGLGLTANDITREAVSEFSGVHLIPGNEVSIHIRDVMGKQPVHGVNEYSKQMLVPEGALVIINDNGTAAGFAFCHNQKIIVCLPGVPGEMQSMLRKFLEVSDLRYKTEEGCTLSRDLHTFGISEIVTEGVVKRCLFSDYRVKTMTLVHDGIITINLLSNATTRRDAVKLLDTAEHNIRQGLGFAVFGVGDETLEYSVAMLLKQRKKTIAVAESCTGGMVSDKLTNIPGISDYFIEGIVAYSNRAKIERLGVPERLITKHGAVSWQVAKAMAEGIRERASADIGIGITGIAGPGGGTERKPVGLVYLGVAGDGAGEVKECRFPGSRISIKKFSTNTALNMVRLKLLHII